MFISPMVWDYRSIWIGVWTIVCALNASGRSEKVLLDLTGGKKIIYTNHYLDEGHPLSPYSTIDIEYPELHKVDGEPPNPKVNEWLKHQVMKHTRSIDFKRRYMAAVREAVKAEFTFNARNSIPPAAYYERSDMKLEMAEHHEEYAPALFSIENRLLGYFDDIVMLRIDLKYTVTRSDGRHRYDGVFCYNHVAYINTKTGKTYDRDDVLNSSRSEEFVEYFLDNVPLSPERSDFTREEIASGYGYWDGTAVVFTVQGGFSRDAVTDAGELPVQIRIPPEDMESFVNRTGPLKGIRRVKLAEAASSGRMYTDYWDGLGPLPFAHRRWIRVYPELTPMTGVRELRIYRDSILRYRYIYDKSGNIQLRAMYWDRNNFDSVTVTYKGSRYSRISGIDDNGTFEIWEFDKSGNLTLMKGLRTGHVDDRDSMLTRYRHYDHTGAYAYVRNCYRSAFYCFCETDLHRKEFKGDKVVKETRQSGSYPSFTINYYDDAGLFIGSAGQRKEEFGQGYSVFYNEDGHPERIQYGDNVRAITITYQGDQITRIKEGTDQTFTFEYNKQGQLIRAFQDYRKNNSPANDHVFTYEYDLWE